MAPLYQLSDPRNIEYGLNKWWGKTIQSYVTWQYSLGKYSGLHKHHLLPKSLLQYGPLGTRDLEDFIPSVTFDPIEHNRTLHVDLDNFLRNKGFWQRPLSKDELSKAILKTESFYRVRGLTHFAEAIKEFHQRVYLPAVAL